MSKYTLDQPKVIRTAFTIETKSVASENGYDVITISGYASRMYDATGKLVVDADQEIVNTSKVDLKRLALGRMPLLFQHDQSQIVGNVMKAEQRPEGLYVEAQVVKLPDDPISTKVYHGVKSGILNSFSIGAIIKNFDTTKQDGIDYLVLDESELIELSIVSVPSNHESGFRVMGTKGLAIDKTSMKAMNPTLCDDISCVISKALENQETTETTTKGLTYSETENEGWFKSQEFFLSLEVLSTTISDNWFANKWDELPAEEAKSNIIDACATFISSKLDMMVPTQAKQDQTTEASIASKGIDMEKTITETQGIQNEPQEQNVVTSGDAELPVTTNDTPSVVPQDETKATIEDAKDEPKVPEVEPKEEPKEEPKVTLEVVEGFINNLDLDTVDADYLEKLLTLAESINVGIEAKVKEQLTEALTKPAA